MLPNSCMKSPTVILILLGLAFRVSLSGMWSIIFSLLKRRVYPKSSLIFTEFLKSPKIIFTNSYAIDKLITCVVCLDIVNGNNGDSKALAHISQL